MPLQLIKLNGIENYPAMKTMTCKQLGGACDLEFRADTFEEMSKLSRSHGVEMAQKQDPAHLRAMDEMRKLIQQPGAMEDWMKQKQREFDALPDS